MLLLISCGSTSSVVGNKTKKINTKCDNCTNNRQYFKAYGEAEIISGPRVKMAAISQARTFARNEMVADKYPGSIPSYSKAQPSEKLQYSLKPFQ